MNPNEDRMDRLRGFVDGVLATRQRIESERGGPKEL